jgi:hypothetical protein
MEGVVLAVLCDSTSCMHLHKVTRRINPLFMPIYNNAGIFHECEACLAKYGRYGHAIIMIKVYWMKYKQACFDLIKEKYYYSIIH